MRKAIRGGGVGIGGDKEWGETQSVRWSDIGDLLHKSSPEQMRLYQAAEMRGLISL